MKFVHIQMVGSQDLDVVGPLTEEQYAKVTAMIDMDDAWEWDDIWLFSFDEFATSFEVEAADTKRDMGVSLGDLTRDAKDPRDIYS